MWQAIVIGIPMWLSSASTVCWDQRTIQVVYVCAGNHLQTPSQPAVSFDIGCQVERMPDALVDKTVRVANPQLGITYFVLAT